MPAMMGRGGMIMSPGMADDDPELMELAQAEGELAAQTSEIVERFADSENAAERKRITAELRETLAKQFDVQRRRRELELARVDERVSKLRDQIKKRDDARETIIDRRLDQLLNDADGLGWTPPAGASGGRGNALSGAGSNKTAPVQNFQRK